MAYTGIQLPGIVSPDESVEQFARLYGNDHVDKMMILASRVGNPYNLPGKPHPLMRKESRNPEYCSYLNRPANVDDRNLMMNPRFCGQSYHGSRPMRHGGYGDLYNPSPVMGHHNRRYSHQEVNHQQEIFGFPRAPYGSTVIRHGGYGDHYNPSRAMENYKPEYFLRYAQQGVPQPARQYSVAENKNHYFCRPPSLPVYPWL